MLSCTASPSMRVDRSGWRQEMTAELFAAIKSGDMATVERVLERDRGLVDARDEDGLSPVLAGLYHGGHEIATAVLRRGPRRPLFAAAAARGRGRVADVV